VRCQGPGEGRNDADAEQDEGEAGEGVQRTQAGQAAGGRSHGAASQDEQGEAPNLLPSLAPSKPPANTMG